MFVAARRDVAIMQEEVQRGQARAQLEARIGTLQKERKFLLGAFIYVRWIIGCLVDV
jgi:hypothetical protein